MNVKDFIEKYNNHPILFIGTGFSLRYLNNSFTWDGLLDHMCFELTNNEEHYLDLKHKHTHQGNVNYMSLASELEKEFNTNLSQNRNGKFSAINDIFYENMRNNISLSRFKIFISEIFKKIDLIENKSQEIDLLKQARKNIGSIITTNYDNLIEKIFEFNKLIGNGILLSNPYGSVYKIHGCCSDASKIVITDEDYQIFDKKYELIRAQLLSLFIHNPIIFIGYSVNDENIRKILKTIFSYVEPNSEEAEKIKNNFLLIEYEEDSDNELISDHDIVLDDRNTIRINKLKTDNYSSIYEGISNLTLPVTALDIRKVQNVVKEIYAGGSIRVSITEDLDNLKNGDKILAIGSTKTIQYQFQTAPELMSNYFKIIDENNKQLLILIDKLTINKTQFFPIFSFAKICPEILCKERLMSQQNEKINEISQIINITERCKIPFTEITDILESEEIITSLKLNCIIWNYFQNNISDEKMKYYLINSNDTNNTNYRKLLTIYDYKINIEDTSATPSLRSEFTSTES